MANDHRSMISATEPRVSSPDGPDPRTIQWTRKLAAMFIALIADAPPVCLLSESYPLVFDVVVAVMLWLVLGRSRLMAMALVIECIPGVGLAPTWTAFVLFNIVAGKAKTKASPSAADAAKPPTSQRLFT